MIQKWLYMEFGLLIEFFGLFTLIITINYNSIMGPHTYEITTACAKSSQSAVSSLAVGW
jgi:hypothetical protein